MNPFAMASLFAVIISVALAVIVYTNNPKNMTNRVFVLVCVLLAYGSFTEFMYRQALDIDTARLWFKIGAFWPVLMAAILHFALVFTEKSKLLKNKWTYPFIYIPPVVFSILTLTNGVLAEDLIKMPWGWVPVASRGVASSLAIIWIAGVTLLSAFLLWQHYFRQTEHQKRQQVRDVAVVVSIPVVAGLATYVVLPLFQLRIPEIMAISLAYGNILIGYGIWKHKLFTVGLETAAENILSTMSDLLFLTDSKGKIIRTNQAALSVLGFHEEDLVNQQLITLLSEEPPEGFGCLSLAAGVHDLESVLKTRTGESIPVSLSSSALRRGKDDVFGLVIIARNITDRKKAEAEIQKYQQNLEELVDERTVELAKEVAVRKKAEENTRRAAEEWRTTFDSITDMVSIHDRDFKLVRVNKAFADAISLKPKQLIGRTCYELVHGTNEPVLNCPHMRALETKKPATWEFFITSSGISMEIATSPIFDDKGDVVATVHIARDITERKQMQEQLILTDRLASLGELAAGVAHEVNNPLTSIIGYSDIILELNVPDDMKGYLEIVNKEANRAADVVKNLLTFARKHPRAKEPVDINEIIQEVLTLRAYEQKTSNISVKTQFDTTVPKIKADAFQLQQVFLNIIINAEFAMITAHGRGTLNITTMHENNAVRAIFADDGPGIAKDSLEHLFDPFFTTKEVGEGTGLGLSISYRIIKDHNGTVRAESKKGKGATFIIELPTGE